MKAEQISRQQRDSTGVKAMKMDDDADLAAFTVVPPEEAE
jgi:hypothetical protein